MKHSLLLCAALILLFCSCSKEKRITPGDGGKKYPVKFDVSGFTQIYEPQGGATGKVRTADVDSLPVTTLAYVVFKDNQIVSIKTSKKGDVGFGTFTDELSPGSYQIALGGGSPAVVYIQNNTYQSDFGAALLYGDDLFFKKVPLTVTNTAVTQAIELKRISSQLVVNINDAIPANVSSIRVSLKDTTGYIMTKQQYFSYNEHTVTKQISAADAGKINYRIVVNNSHNVTPFTITVSYVQSGKTVSKVISNVVCKTNMRTILSGNLFGSSSTDFDMKIDRNWNAPVYIDF